MSFLTGGKPLATATATAYTHQEEEEELAFPKPVGAPSDIAATGALPGAWPSRPNARSGYVHPFGQGHVGSATKNRMQMNWELRKLNYRTGIPVACSDFSNLSLDCCAPSRWKMDCCDVSETASNLGQGLNNMRGRSLNYTCDMLCMNTPRPPRFARPGQYGYMGAGQYPGGGMFGPGGMPGCMPGAGGMMGPGGMMLGPGGVPIPGGMGPCGMQGQMGIPGQGMMPGPCGMGPCGMASMGPCGMPGMYDGFSQMNGMGMLPQQGSVRERSAC